MTQEETCASKKRYPDKIVAEIMRAKYMSRNLHRKRDKHESRSYHCRVCDGWHLTSRPRKIIS